MRKTPLENWVYGRAGLADSDVEKFKRWQFSKIFETLTYARTHSRFYENHLRQVNFENFKGLEDLKQIPFTTAQDIAEDPEAFLCVPQRSIKRVVTLTTSGTIGTEKRIFFTENDLERTIDFFDHGMRVLTDTSDRVMVMLPGRAYGTIGDLLNKALRRRGTYCSVHGVLKSPDAAAEQIVSGNINCLVGIPIQVLYLSRVKPEAFKQIDKVLLSTDYIPQALVTELDEKFDCRVYNHYGMTEMGYGGGVVCDALTGCHMRECDLYFEVIDPSSGALVPDGTYGEVVFTTLDREAMPLIRYRTGDIGAFSSEKCACGTILRTMKKVLGRFNNNIECGGIKIPFRVFDELILPFEAVADFKVVKSESNVLLIDIVWIPSRGQSLRSIQMTIEDQVRRAIHPAISMIFKWTKDPYGLTANNSMNKRIVQNNSQPE